jgi:predicted nuclease of predicted toxin-antitoxin system
VKAFVLDENVPACLRFTPTLPVIACRDALGGSASDADIWEYARQTECVIITKDADFSDLMLASTPPPWVIHLRFGNLRRQDYHALLARVWPRLETLLPEHKLIRVYEDRIEAFKK